MLMLFQAAAQAVDAVSKGAVPVSDPGSAITFESYVHQATVVAVTVWVIQMVKRSRMFPGINANSETATRILSTLAALVGALAIQVSVTGDATIGWHGSFNIPNIHALWDGVGRFVGSKLGQDWVYQRFFNKPVEVVPVAPPPMDAGGKPIETRSVA